MKSTRMGIWLAAVGLLILGGCAAPNPYDYSAFVRAKPATLLVMPPVSEAPEVEATPGVWAQATLPLAEAGYYVLPVTLVDETFRQNGVFTANDAQDISVQKLREVFHADAAVYLKVKQYGTSYVVVSSDTQVQVEGRIVDLRSGELLWEGTAMASSREQQNNSAGLAGILISAIINQIIAVASDAAFTYAGIADQRLLSPRANGVLPGPRSPMYGRVAGTR